MGEYNFSMPFYQGLLSAFYTTEDFLPGVPLPLKPSLSYFYLDEKKFHIVAQRPI